MPHPGDFYLVHLGQGPGWISEILTSDSQCIPGREATTGSSRLVSFLYLVILALHHLNLIIVALLWILISGRSSYNSWKNYRYLLLPIMLLHQCFSNVHLRNMKNIKGCSSIQEDLGSVLFICAPGGGEAHQSLRTTTILESRWSS